jgi:hypothetical protein
MDVVGDMNDERNDARLKAGEDSNGCSVSKTSSDPKTPFR